MISFINNLIEEFEYKRESAMNNPEDYFGTTDLDIWKKGIKELDDRIIELRTKEAEAKDISNTTDDTIVGKNVVPIVLGDITIVPGKCITIGNYAISDYNTYMNMRNLFEKGIDSYRTNLSIKNEIILLRSGQFSSGLKFLYATIKYIISADINGEDNLYRLEVDNKFVSYFKEAGKVFEFINKENADLSNKDMDYWRGPRNYCKKILGECSKKASIVDKEGGKRERGFYLRVEKE